MLRPDQIVHKAQHVLACGWDSGGTRALVQGINDDENRILAWESDHGLETFREVGIARPCGTFAARFVQLMKDIPATSRVVTELEEKGHQEAADMALGGVVKIKVVVGDQGRLLFCQVLDVFDNGGADRKH